MQKQPLKKQELKKEDIIGSETVFEKLKSKTPWIFGGTAKLPKNNKTEPVIIKYAFRRLIVLYNPQIQSLCNRF